MIKKNQKRFVIGIGVVVLLILFFYWQNNDIVVTNIDYVNQKIPESFDGLKILHVSDLHNKEFGKNQKYLIKHTKEIQPDIIVITGDLIDRDRTDISIALEYVAKAIEIAPIFYVNGNHEKWSGVYDDLKRQLVDVGVKVLDNEALALEKNGERVGLVGLMDSEYSGYVAGYGSTDEKLDELKKSVATEFTMLLSHRPELLSSYAENDYDLVFSGHAHGGQFRLPFIGGLYAPGQGAFSKYTSGITVKDNTTMVVSRGLGNSVIPVRIFNRPELVVVTLKRY